MKKWIMIIGPRGSGKTTLAHHLDGRESDRPLKKTQDIIYGNRAMDTPSAYLENPWMYKHLIAAAQQASEILVLVDGEKPKSYCSPGFTRVFTVPVTGIITKVDADTDLDSCRAILERMGVKPPYKHMMKQTDQFDQNHHICKTRLPDEEDDDAIHH